ncbi:MAG: zinc-binding dehydrogenase [Phycisphaerae bacterium]
MKAVTIRGHGGPEVVRVEEVDDPSPAVGEVVLRVQAAALNHLDLWVRIGPPGMDLEFPHVLGSDAAGVVAEVGEGVHGVSVGDEVVLNPGLSCGCCEACRRGEQSACRAYTIVGLGRWGTFAERVSVPARCVSPKPDHLDWPDAAALPLAYLTAWRMVMTRSRVAAGETVLIHGIGGGVALASLQIAKLAGAWVIVTSSSDEKLARAEDLGADATVNYRAEPDVAKAVIGATGGRGVDVVVDTVGAATWPVDFEAVRRGGRIVNCGVTTGAEATTPLHALYWKQVTVLGSTMGSDEDFRRLLLAVRANELAPVVHGAYPLADAADALACMEAGEQFGKIVLEV